MCAKFRESAQAVKKLHRLVACLCAGFVGPRTLSKTLSTTFFLYFACLLPSIALGVLNDNNTKHEIGG